MKKLFIILSVLTLLATPQFSFATSKPTVSLSDAIIADLALRNYLDYISIYFQDKKSPNTITLNSSKQWIPASTVKLFVAMFAFDQIAKKNISLSDWVTIDDKNVVPTELETDEYPVLTPGLTTTVDILLQKMITQSDNTAYNTLLDLLDRQNVTAYIQSIGLKHTIIGSKLNLDDNQTQYEFTTPGYNINTTTAEDYAKAYELLDKDSIANSDKLLNILARQKINSMLPGYLPKTLTIEHKTGDLDPLYHDGGIVLGNNQHYILTMFSNLGNPNILAHISQIIYTRNYSLVGNTIPDKNDDSKPDGIQALDPLVMNTSPEQAVLGATTPINVPLPNITAADLGISDKDVSLAIATKDLPKATLPPLLSNIWFGVQKAVVLGEKSRQSVDISYAKTELSRAQALTKEGKTQEAAQTLHTVAQVVEQVAKDHTLPPDEATQLEIKSVSETRFSLLHDQLASTKTDDARAVLIKNIADQARTHLTEVEPHLTDAKAATNLSQKPIVGKIVDATPDHLVVQTSGGQQVTIPIDQTVKVKEQPTVIAPTNTPTPTEPSSLTPTISPTLSVSPSQEISPTQSLQPIQTFKIGSSIAVLGSTKGNVVTPSLIVNNIPREIAAPHPVVAVKVNQKDNTMVVSDNGNLVQVNLTPKTAIKAKDTNVELQSIKPGTVMVVHGNAVEQVKSDSSIPQVSVSPTFTPTDSSTNPKPSSATQPSQSVFPTGIILPSVNTQPSPSGNQPSPAVSQTQQLSPAIKQGVNPALPIKSLTTIPTAVPSATKQPTITKPVIKQPEIIRATSIQVIQQTTTSPSKINNPSQPAKNENKPQQNQPAQQPQKQQNTPQKQPPTNSKTK